MNKRMSPREARKETRAIIVLLIIVVIGVVLMGYQYFTD
jgi:cytochrome c oxidase assembly protein Cox11